MNELSIDDIGHIRSLVVWGTLGICVVLGMLMARTNFCTMGGVADIVSMGSWNRMRMWVGAMGVATIGTQLMAASGVIDPGASFYTTPRWNWLSSIVGGLLFGFGMVLASGCGSRTLIRIGGGSLKSLVVAIVLGISAYMTMRGILARIRVDWLDSVHVVLPVNQDLPNLLLRTAGMDAEGLSTVNATLGLVIGGAMLVFAFAPKAARTSDVLLGALGVGIAVCLLWWVSGSVGHVAEHPDTLEEAYIGTASGRMEALSFVAPLAQTLELLMMWTDSSRVVVLGIAATIGLVLGSLIWHLLRREFRWQGLGGAEDTANHLIGATLMGAGGVTALGCTFGQGLSAISLLAISAFVATAAIIAGAWLGLRYQLWRMDV